MDKGFKLFKTYAGTIRRKEDFFTYYLASLLDYLYLQNPEYLHTCFLYGFKLTQLPEVLLRGNEVKDLVTESVTKISFAAQPNSVVFREVGLPGPNGNLYLDVMSVGRKNNQLNVYAIEGKVFDGSVRIGQLEQYNQSIRQVFGQDVQIELILLTTIRYKDDGSTSYAQDELNRTKPTDNTHISLILWDEIQQSVEGLLPQINDEYFTKVFFDAFNQIALNSEKDKRVIQSSNKNIQFSLSEYLHDNEVVRELSKLIDFLREKGIEIEESNSQGKRMINIPITKAILPYANQIGNWIQHVLERGKQAGTLQEVPSKVTITNNLANRFNSSKTKQKCRSVLSCLEGIAEGGGLPNPVERDIQKLKDTVQHTLKENLAKQLLEDFLVSISDTNSVSFYREFCSIAGVTTSQYLRMVSNATETVRKLGLHVSLAQSRKQKHISIMTLGPNNIWIPLSK